MNVSAWSIKNPIPAVMLFVMLTFAGLLAFKAMKVQQFPDLELPTVVVSAALPGAAPAQLETEVARKIENAIAPLQGLKNIYTKVQDGGVTITAEFRLEKATQEAVDDVRSAVQGVRSDLPADVRDPVISKVNLSGAPILAFTVRAASMDDEALSWLVDNTVARRLLGVKGVGSVNRVGGVTRQIEVALDPLKLQSLGGTAADISRQLRQVQTESAGGRADSGWQRATHAHGGHRTHGGGAGRSGAGPAQARAPAPERRRSGQRHGGRATGFGLAQWRAGGGF